MLFCRRPHGHVDPHVLEDHPRFELVLQSWAWASGMGAPVKRH